MIYIFTGCQNICSLPGYLCSACGQVCKHLPGGLEVVCKPCQAGCAHAGSYVKHFFERPLSAYVIVSLLVSLYTVFLAMLDMNSKPGCSSNFLYILMAFAVINVIFAIYMQARVWSHIMSDDNQHEFVDGDKSARVSSRSQESETVRPGKIIVPKEVVQASFKQVFMEDFGVLAMFVGLLAICFLSWNGPQWIDGAPPKCRGQVKEGTKDMGYTFFWVAAVWCFFYMCCGCCANKVTIEKDDEHEYQAVPGMPA